MPDNPRVTIVIAAFQAEKYIEKSILSARNQTMKALEIIIVDDASTDGTAAFAIAHAKQDQRVMVLTLPMNCGPGAARNAAISRARGDWIAILDADDQFLPERLETLVNLGEIDGLDMIADNPTLLEPGKVSRLLIEGDVRWPIRMDPQSFIDANQGAWGQGRILYGFLKPLFRRSFLGKHGLRYRPLRLAEDYFISLEALLHGAKWSIIAESFYNYTVRRDSLTASISPVELDAMAEADRLVLANMGSMMPSNVVKAIRRHGSDVAGAAAWTRLVQAIRARDPHTFLVKLPKSPATWMAFAGQLGRACCRLSRRHLLKDA